MKISGPLKFGEFLRRPNRFLAICRLNGQEIPCYIPNPGPMPDLLFPGVEVLLRYTPESHRKTGYDLICVRHQGVLLSLDSRVPNQLLATILPKRRLKPFAQYDQVATEPLYEGSRLDFLLTDGSGPPCLIEAKSSTHAVNHIAYFPRAVTHRGQRHLQELMHAVHQGMRAAMVFIIQRKDADRLRPNDLVDPEFGTVLRQAAQTGVEMYAWTTRFDEQNFQITIDRVIPVDISPPTFL